MKTCYLYTRIASQAQSNSNSINQQRKVCLDYAKQHNYKVIKTFEDTGASGINLIRKGLQQLLIDCKKEKIDAVIVARIDRISRKVSDFIKINKKLKERKIQLISVADGDLSTQNLVASILIGIAQWELERDKQE